MAFSMAATSRISDGQHHGIVRVVGVGFRLAQNAHFLCPRELRPQWHQPLLHEQREGIVDSRG